MKNEMLSSPQIDESESTDSPFQGLMTALSDALKIGGNFLCSISMHT